ncbi:MAG: ABC transporter permease [Chloroflexota bacterium]
MTVSESATPIHAVPATEQQPVVSIRPSKGWISLRLDELWQYRELLYFLVWRDVKVRYKQTIMGASWAIIQPLMTMIVFSIFFGGLAGIQADGNIPYPIFAYTALVPWALFSESLSRSVVMRGCIDQPTTSRENRSPDTASPGRWRYS